MKKSTLHAMESNKLLMLLAPLNFDVPNIATQRPRLRTSAWSPPFHIKKKKKLANSKVVDVVDDFFSWGDTPGRAPSHIWTH
jgi:hypothetical protein